MPLVRIKARSSPGPSGAGFRDDVVWFQNEGQRHRRTRGLSARSSIPAPRCTFFMRGHATTARGWMSKLRVHTGSAPTGK